MKSTRPTEAKFEPVHLILESQHEVDAMYALLNHGPTSDGAGLPEHSYKSLQPFANRPNSESILEDLRTHLINVLK